MSTSELDWANVCQHRVHKTKKTKQKQSRETGNIGYIRPRKQNKNTTQYVLYTTVRKKKHTSHGTQNVKTHNRTQKTKQKQKTWATQTPPKNSLCFSFALLHRCGFVIATKILRSSSQYSWPLRNIHITNDNGYFTSYVDVNFGVTKIKLCLKFKIIAFFSTNLHTRGK
jgi:hypothetical protein